jgi:hypothetical protein
MALYLLSTYNFLSDVLKTAVSGAGTLTNAVCNYLNGTSNEWYFVNGTGVIPAVAYSIPSRSYGNRILWTYNTFRNTLVQRYEGVQPVALKCNWLSIQLIADGVTYTLDDWLRELYLVIDDYDEFTVSVLIDAWSVRHKIWPTDDAELHIIDSEGASHVFSVSDPINEEWSALVPKPRVAEEPYIGEDEDEDEDEDEVETSLLDTDRDMNASIVTPVNVPVVDADAHAVDAPAVDAPAVDAPAVDAPVADTPVVEAPPISVEPTAETPPIPVEPPAPEVTPLPQSPAPEQEDVVSNE